MNPDATGYPSIVFTITDATEGYFSEASITASLNHFTQGEWAALQEQINTLSNDNHLV